MTRKAPWLVLFFLLFMFVNVPSASAGCVRDFADCTRAAFEYERWYDRMIAMADCELDFAACAWNRLFG